MQVSMNVSPGELVDRITILRIKAQRITDARKLSFVESDLQSALAILEFVRHRSTSSRWRQLTPLMERLFDINSQIWDIEDRIRRLEKEKRFDGEFVETARAVYHTNDERAAVKRQIDQLYASQIAEQKSYADYQ